LQSQLHLAKHLREHAGYFEVPDAHLYTVLHQVENPLARVLLVGPFASERHFSYHPWIRWARYLADRQVEVLRYDYRGVGESTGLFEDITFENWADDVSALASWLADRSPSVPLILHGLEVGAILASISFDKGQGDALLLWSPPPSANHALRSSLLRWAGLEQLWESSENRKSAADYIREIEGGASIEVAGYQWSSRLWRDSFSVGLQVDIQDSGVARGRPVRAVKLGADAAPLVKPYVGYDEVKDLSWLYSENFAWLAEVLAVSTGGRT